MLKRYIALPLALLIIFSLMMPKLVFSAPNWQDPYTFAWVNVVSAGSGSSGSGMYYQGTFVSINAGTAPAGYTFSHWSAYIGMDMAEPTTPISLGFSNPHSASTGFYMLGFEFWYTSINVVAVFEEEERPGQYFDVYISSAGANPSGSGTYMVGANVSIYAGTPPAGQQFINWTIRDGPAQFSLADANSARTTFIMPAGDVSLLANFSPVADFPVFITSEGSNASGAGNFTPGTTVNIFAGNPPLGYRFLYWTTQADGVAISLVNRYNPRTSFSMPAAAVYIVAHFEPEPTVGLDSGGVRFSYVDFPNRPRAYLDEEVVFRIDVIPTRAGWDANFGTLRYDWLRNGRLWTGEGASGTIAARDVTNYASISLELEAGLTNSRRGGNWSLRVTLLDRDRYSLFEDVSRVSALEIRTAPGQAEPEPEPEPPPVEQPVIIPAAPVQLVDPLSPAALDQITDQESAVRAVENAMRALQGRDNVAGLDPRAFLALFADNAIMRAASTHVSGGHVVVNQSNLAPLQDTSRATRDAINQMLMANSFPLNRGLVAGVSFASGDYPQLSMQIEPSAAMAEQILVRTPYYSLSFNQRFIANDVNRPLLLRVVSDENAVSPTGTPSPSSGWFPMSESGNAVDGGTYLFSVAGASPDLLFRAAMNGGTAAQRSYTISFDRPVSEPLRLALPPNPGDPAYQTIVSSASGNIGGNHNPATGLLEARISESGNYTVVENRIDFTDIQGRSAEMQRAIRSLATQGILTGMAPGEFFPDNPLTRAQIAAMVTNILDISAPGADYNFRDVHSGNWFFLPVNSVRRQNLMTGTGADIFSPHLHIPRDQMIAISARILRQEMNYSNPASPMSYLQTFSDADNFAYWSITDLSLATRENLVIRRADGMFVPRAAITRGEAAIILYRLYRRIW